MRCPIETQESAEQLLAYAARRLDPDAAAVFERHMESCASCREFAAAQRLQAKLQLAREALQIDQRRTQVVRHDMKEILHVVVERLHLRALCGNRRNQWSVGASCHFASPTLVKFTASQPLTRFRARERNSRCRSHEQ